MLRDHLAHDAPGGARAHQATNKSKQEMLNRRREEQRDAIEPLVKSRVGNEADAVDVGSEQRLKFVARAFVDDQPHFDAALAKQAEVMQWQDRFAAEFRRRVLRDNQNPRMRSLPEIIAQPSASPA